MTDKKIISSKIKFHRFSLVGGLEIRPKCVVEGGSKGGNSSKAAILLLLPPESPRLEAASLAVKKRRKV